jgi:hypothetical protein
VADRHAQDVVAAAEEATAAVALDQHLERVGCRHERHLDLVQPARERGRRAELQLLVAVQRRTGDAATLDVGAAEGAADPFERREDALLCRQRLHPDGIEVALVPGLRDLQLRADADGHLRQVPPGDHVERRLQWQCQPERDGPPLAGSQDERTGCAFPTDPLLADRLAVLAVVAGVLVLGPHDERQVQVADLLLELAGEDLDDPVERAARPTDGGVHDRVHGRAAAEPGLESLEHHGCPLPSGGGSVTSGGGDRSRQ